MNKKNEPLLWLSDLHLDMVDQVRRDAFYERIKEHPAKKILLSGDIADGIFALSYLSMLRDKTQKEIYFILGNHDFYGMSIDLQRKRAEEASRKEHSLYYLTAQNEPIALTDNLALIGHDGWADGREGNFFRSTVGMRDYFEIIDLKARNPAELFEKLNELADDAKEKVEARLVKALEQYDEVIFLTHVPPFRSASLYDEQVTGDNWAPHFVSKCMGEMLERVMKEHPEKSLLVLAGHSHHKADVKILDNLHVRVQEATYGEPGFEVLFN